MKSLEEIRILKQQLGITNEMLAKRSGVPLSTVQKVMAGTTKSPRHSTLKALSDVISRESEGIFVYSARYREPFAVHEARSAYAAKKGPATIEDIYALPDGVRAELLDGKLYFMAAPTRTHQKIAGEMHLIIANYIREKGGACEVYIPPFGVYLNGDDSSYLEPDLTVVCDTDKLEEKGCVGAPDMVVEVLSPSSRQMDCLLKLGKYREAGVREYWIIYPDKRTVQVFRFEGKEEEFVELYSFDDKIPCGIFPGLHVSLRHL